MGRALCSVRIPALDLDDATGDAPAPAQALASAQQLAVALLRGELAEVEGLFTDEAALWASRSAHFRACVGRANIVGALGRMVARERPKRIRVLRSGMSSVVLAAFAGDRALWSLEITLARASVDGVMAWFPVGSPALAAAFD